MVNLVYTYLTRIQFPKTYRDLRIMWCHLSTIPGTTPHCLVSTGGDVNFLGTRNLVYLSHSSAPLKEVLGGQYNYREGGRQVLRQGAKGRRRSRSCQCSKDPCAQKVSGGRTYPSPKYRW